MTFGLRPEKNILESSNYELYLVGSGIINVVIQACLWVRSASGEMRFCSANPACPPAGDLDALDFTVRRDRHGLARGGRRRAARRRRRRERRLAVQGVRRRPAADGHPETVPRGAC